MPQPKEVFFFTNGNSAVVNDKEQIPELQKPWILMFVDFLVSQGHDPTTIRYNLPGGVAEVFKTTDGGYNWRIK